MYKSKKRSAWTEGDEVVLLELWEERSNDLRRAKRNGHIFMEMSVTFEGKFSAEEIHTKIWNLTSKYRIEKKEMGPSGGSPSQWKHFNAVHKIIGGNASNSASVLESFSIDSVPEDPLTSEWEALPSDWEPFQGPESESCPVIPSPSPISVSATSAGELTSPSIPISNTAASSSSKRKRDHLGELVKISKEQNQLSHEIISAIREQNETAKDFVNLMKEILNKI